MSAINLSSALFPWRLLGGQQESAALLRGLNIAFLSLRQLVATNTMPGSKIADCFCPYIAFRLK
jgi:hypothetical protein